MGQTEDKNAKNQLSYISFSMCVYIDFSVCFYTHAHIHIDIHTHLKTLTQIKKITVTNLYLLICKDLRSTKRKP